MGRHSAPFASVVHLKILMGLYEHHYKIYSNANDISEEKYLDILRKRLVNDNIVKENSSNLIDKLRGMPYQSDMSKCEGIDIRVIEMLAEKVIRLYQNSFQIDIENTEVFWPKFKEYIPIPDYLKPIQEYKYYKFLSKSDKKLIDDFVVRKISEFENDNDNLHTYCAYFWNDQDKDMEIAILQMTKKPATATIKYLYTMDGKWKTKSVQRTDKLDGLYQLKHSTCYMHFVEEDDFKSHLRTNLCLAIHDSEFFSSLKYIKGTYSTSVQSATMPVAGVIMLERKKSYQDAFNSIIERKIDDKIYFELLGQRIVVNDEKLKSHNQFHTFKAQKALEKIAGAYIFGFFRKKHSQESRTMVTKGLCFLEKNGIITSKIQSEETIRGHVSNEVYYGDDILCFSHFFNASTDHFKYQYTLQVFKDKSVPNTPFIGLDGIYAGMDTYAPRAGRIFFMKVEGYESFSELLSSERNNTERFYTDSKQLSVADNLILTRLMDSNSYLVTP